MSFHIFHVISSLGVGGGQSMMFELHEAFSRYHEDVSQSIHLINSSNADKKFIRSYGVEFESNTSAQIVKKAIRHKGDSVLLYHKLMASKTDFLRPVYTRSPVIVLNHTHSESVQYNRIRNADKIIAVCENMKHNLNKMRVPIQIDVIHNGVNGDRYEEILPMERSIDNVLLTGRVNALNRIKYSESWLDWCLQVDLPKKMIHEYMGGGEYLKSARRYVGSVRGSKNDVHILGSISEFDKKVSRMKSWDIFLYDINRDEGLSMAVLEALASGVPVVCSNHFGNKEVIKDGVNGFVYRNKAELENILTELCIQPELIEDMKVKTVEDFNRNLDAKITSSKYRKVIEKVIKGKENKKAEDSASIKIPEGKRKKAAPPPKIKIKPKRKKIMVTENKEKVVKEIPKEDENDKFTIITSSYNNAAWLGDWSDSILRQAYRPLEVVFVDDCNSDKTPSIIEGLKPKFEEAGIEFKSIRNPKRLHCGSSYKVGFEAATGYFMGVVDSDDVITADAVEYVMKLYKDNPEIGWIYTQFEICNRSMACRKRGFCSPPPDGQSLLDMGKRGRHAYSHWRTFSRRVPKLSKIWKQGLECAVDKFMGYRLEEWSPGMFADHVCYKYREGVKHSISTKGKSKIVWRKIIAEAEGRRKKYKLKPHKIYVHKD